VRRRLINGRRRVPDINGLTAPEYGLGCFAAERVEIIADRGSGTETLVSFPLRGGIGS